MLAVRWTADALAQLDTVTTYVQARNFDAAERLRLLFEDAAERLSLTLIHIDPDAFRERAKRSFIPTMFSSIALAPRRSTSWRSSMPANNIPDLGIRVGAR